MLAELQEARRRLGITYEEVAAEAARTSKRRPRPAVSFSTVAHVLARRTVSANIVSAARRLVRERSRSRAAAPVA